MNAFSLTVKSRITVRRRLDIFSYFILFCSQFNNKNEHPISEPILVYSNLEINGFHSNIFGNVYTHCEITIASERMYQVSIKNSSRIII